VIAHCFFEGLRALCYAPTEVQGAGGDAPSTGWWVGGAGWRAEWGALPAWRRPPQAPPQPLLARRASEERARSVKHAIAINTGGSAGPPVCAPCCYCACGLVTTGLRSCGGSRFSAVTVTRACQVFFLGRARWGWPLARGRGSSAQLACALPKPKPIAIKRHLLPLTRNLLPTLCFLVFRRPSCPAAA
jgi:hypothetical protein